MADLSSACAKRDMLLDAFSAGPGDRAEWDNAGEVEEEPPPSPVLPEECVFYSAATNRVNVKMSMLSSFTDVPEVVISELDSAPGEGGEGEMINMSIFKLRPTQTYLFAKMEDHVRTEIAKSCVRAAYTVKQAQGYAGAFKQFIISRVLELMQQGTIPSIGESTVDVFVSADDLDLSVVSPSRHFMAINITANLAKHALPLRLNLDGAGDNGGDTIVLVSCAGTRPSGQPGTLALELRIQFVAAAVRTPWLDARGKRVPSEPDPTIPAARTPNVAAEWTRSSSHP
jgi:hypothetical protein